jgi:hypothetical protein
MLIGEQWYFNYRIISKKKYLILCEQDPTLPRFSDEKPANTLGRWIRQLRKEKEQRRKLGPLAEDIAEQKWVDGTSLAETRKAGSKEVVSWLKRRTSGERALGDLTRGESLRLARKLYARGAVKVWAAGIQRSTDGGQYTSELVLTLPIDAEQRAKVYKLCIADSSLSVRAGRKHLLIHLF